MAGILLTFRESLVSLLAFSLRMVKRHYSLGDFIEVDGFRGEVIDINWQHTALAEIGPSADSPHYSGRVIHIPNHKLLVTPIIVDNLTGAYGAHVVRIPIPQGMNPLVAEKKLQAAAEANCLSFAEDAQNHLEQLRKAHAIDTPSVAPKITIRFEAEGFTVLVLRIVVPARDKLRLEQQIIREFLAS